MPYSSMFYPHNSSICNLIQDSLARAVMRTPRHCITPSLKSLHKLKIPEQIHFKVLLLPYNSLQYSQPKCLCELFTIQPTHSARSSSSLSFARAQSLLISSSPTEPYPSLHHISGTICQLNSMLFLLLHYY